MAGIVLASAIVGALASGAPTGTDALDLLYRAAFAALVPAVASNARRWTWFVLAGAAGAAATDAWVPFTVAGAALALAFVSVLTTRRQRVLGAVIGALAVQALLRLPTELPFGVPTAVAALAPVPAYVSALRNVHRPRPYAAALAAVVAGLFVAGAAFAAGMLSIEDRATSGLRAARIGIEAARAGDDGRAEGAFAQAEADLADASNTASSWWLGPARAVPVLSQHVHAVDEAAAEGRALAALSADQVATLDVKGLSAPGGGIDVGQVAELAPRARTVADALHDALAAVEDASNQWLLPPARERLDELADEIRDASPAAENTADALEVAPTLLGADVPKRYLVLVGNPAEARELGGFVAAIGTLTADGGALGFDTARSIAAAQLDVQAAAASVDPASLPQPLAGSRPNRFPQNWSNTVDLDAVLDVATELGPAIAGGPVDGVLYLDPYAVAALLEVTGPVAVEGRDAPLTADDAVDHLLREQYVGASLDDTGERKEALRDAAEAAFEDLTSGTLPDPRDLVDALSRPVRAGRLLFATADDEPRPLLERLGLARALDVGTVDHVLIAHDNQRANKMDAYLRRHATYDVEVAADGRLESTLTVELTNALPDGVDPYVSGGGGSDPTEVGLPEGLNRLVLAAYSTFEPTSVTVDGEEVAFGASTVGPLTRTAVPVDVARGSTVEVRYRFAGTVPDSGYSLTLTPNASATGDTVELRAEVDGLETAVARRRWDEVIILDRSGN
ncbi:MAG: DUF4012 domain-containing protein [Acidimicrobiia bacterium]